MAVGLLVLSAAETDGIIVWKGSIYNSKNLSQFI